MSRTWMRRAGLLAAGALATTAPVLLADEASDGPGDANARAVAAAGAWQDLLDAHRAPVLPPPSDTESAVVVLDTGPLAERAPADRAAAAGEIRLQQAALEPALAGLGATINFRYRAVVNGFGIRVPAGRLSLVAELPGVKAVYPVVYLAPAAREGEQDAAPLPLPAPSTIPAAPGVTTTAPATVPATGGDDPLAGPATVALIDAGIQPLHPLLGGAIGPDRLIVGGADFVNGRSEPVAAPDAREAEAHGTQMAGIVLNAPELRNLPPERVPRMRAYRVVARELVDGRVRTLARSDRVIAALDRAVDPDQDDRLGDRSSVILLGLARGFGAGGDDPVVDAAEAAERAGSLVIAPAGNDGPAPDPQAGTVGGPAASPAVLTVGGLAAERGPRTGRLDLLVGPAAASLERLPLMGPEPDGADLPIVVLGGEDGLARGVDVREYTDGRGRSRVRGALVVVARGGGTIPVKARAAAQAGAAALAIWDQDGAGRFPGVSAAGLVALPVVGLGPRQGEALAAHRELRGRLVGAPVPAVAPMVASFSSRGPAAGGGAEPDVIAPAVDVETATPGEGAELRTARVSGTSFAAARVAAMALRLRTEHPELDPGAVRSLFVQAATPIPGVPLGWQGAGIARLPTPGPVTVEPGIVAAGRHARRPTTVTVRLTASGPRDTTVRLAVTDPTGVVVPPGPPVALPGGGSAIARLTIPGGSAALEGVLNVVDGRRRVLGRAPIRVAPPARAVATVEPTVVRVVGGHAEVRVRVGRPGAVAAPSVRAMTLWLVPAAGGTPVRMTAERLRGEWPSGSYRFVLTRRMQSGRELPAGGYRLRVTATAADGSAIRRESRPFRLP